MNKHLLYLFLKKDIIKKLSEKHDSQFIDDVLETLGIPGNLMKKFSETNLKSKRDPVQDHYGDMKPDAY